jgi:hypothetical protein
MSGTTIEVVVNKAVGYIDYLSGISVGSVSRTDRLPRILWSL